MTTAVCLKCGKIKPGAWIACPGCGHVPKSDEDRARHMITTDHFQSAENLQAISARIGAGQAVAFEPKQLQAVMENLRRLDLKHRRRKLVSRVVAGLAVAATVIYFIIRYR